MIIQLVKVHVDVLKHNIVTLCIDINECETSGHNCSQTCTNTPGSYTCSCRTGYKDNGYGNCTGKTTLLKQFCNIAVCFVVQWKPFSSILSNHSILCTITLITKEQCS